MARFGGEEFVILCPNCDISTATRRAEQIRDLISRTDHVLLAGRRATASFGVTEAQPGDTTETILRRADRALYQAKDQGRNRVIQLGTGASGEKRSRGWMFWRVRKPSSPKSLAEEDMIAPGPIRFALEKLRGFVADHQAVLRKTEENMMEFELLSLPIKARRKTDLRRAFTMRLTFWEESSPPATSSGRTENEASQILIHVKVSLDTATAQSDGTMTDYARQVIEGLRAYLMARRASAWKKGAVGQPGEKILLPTWTVL